MDRRLARAAPLQALGAHARDAPSRLPHPPPPRYIPSNNTSASFSAPLHAPPIHMPLPGSTGSIRLPTSRGPILSDLYSRASSVRRLSDARRLVLKSYGPLPHSPLHLRPAMLALVVLAMVLLSLLGFHPTLAAHIAPPVPFSDKLLHFVGLGVASGLFYGVFKVEEEARRMLVWRYFAEGMSGVVCLGGQSSKLASELSWMGEGDGGGGVPSTLADFVLVGCLGWSFGSEFVQALLPYKTVSHRECFFFALVGMPFPSPTADARHPPPTVPMGRRSRK